MSLVNDSHAGGGPGSACRWECDENGKDCGMRCYSDTPVQETTLGDPSQKKSPVFNEVAKVLKEGGEKW